MGRHSAREAWDDAKHPRGPQGRFASRLIIDYYEYPAVKTLAATRAWIKAGQPKSREVYRHRATSAQAAWEAQFGSPFPRPKSKSKSPARIVTSKR